MKCQGCEILDADGLHEDGWCRPQVRLRVGARASALSLRLSVWIPETSTAGADFKVKLGPRSLFRRARRFRANPGESTPFVIPVDVTRGDEVSLMIATRHRCKKTNEDCRDLSFVLHEIAVTQSKAAVGGEVTRVGPQRHPSPFHRHAARNPSAR